MFKNNYNNNKNIIINQNNKNNNILTEDYKYIYNYMIKIIKIRKKLINKKLIMKNTIIMINYTKMNQKNNNKI